MRISDWYPGLKSWLTVILQPDGWYVDEPHDPLLSWAMLPPFRNASLVATSPRSAMLSFIQDIYYTERSVEELWHELPIGRMEGIFSELAWKLVLESKDIHPDVVQLELPGYDEMPIGTEQLGDGWYLTIKWSFRVTVKIDREDPDMVIPITQLGIGLYSAQDPIAENQELDHVVELTLETP